MQQPIHHLQLIPGGGTEPAREPLISGIAGPAGGEQSQPMWVLDLQDNTLLWSNPATFEWLHLSALDCIRAQQAGAAMIGSLDAKRHNLKRALSENAAVEHEFDFKLGRERYTSRCTLSLLDWGADNPLLLCEAMLDDDKASANPLEQVGPAEVLLRYFDVNGKCVLRNANGRSDLPEGCACLGDYIVDAAVYQQIKSAAQARTGLRLEAEVRSGNGNRWHQIDVSGSSDLVTGSFLIELREIDITEEKNASEQLTKLAHYDPLTGLANRNLLVQEYVRISNLYSGQGTKFALLCIDLDGFKLVNDKFGHQAGDEVLKQVATRLRQGVRADDLVSRLGGDEFVVLLTNVETAQQVEFVAEKIRETLATPLSGIASAAKVTPSIGGSIFPDDGSTLDELLSNADHALYEAKEMGKNRYHYFTTGLEAEILRKETLVSDVRRAIAERDLELLYQPRVSMLNREITGYEALLRCRHPVKGLLKPLEFLEIVRDHNLMETVQNWVLNTVCSQLATWRADGCEHNVSINLSQCQLVDPEFAGQLLHRIKEHDLPASALQLEIPEGLLQNHQADARSVLDQLAGNGFELVLDDFGSGHINLAMLRSYPLAKLKIDKPFVANIGTCDVIAMLVSLGKLLNLKIGAEGVETEEQLMWLKSAGCEECQGYYFSKPVSASEIGTIDCNWPASSCNQELPDVASYRVNGAEWVI